MIITDNAFKKRIFILLMVLFLYGIIFVVLNSGIFKTKEEISPLLMLVISEYELNYTPSGLTFDGSNLWITSASNRSIYVVDPNTGEVIKQIKSPVPFPSDITYDGKNLWLIDVISLQIVKLDSNSGAVLSTIKSPGIRPMGLVWNDPYLWVSDPITRRIYQVALNGSVLKSIKGPPPMERPAGLSVKDNMLWIADIEISFILEFETTKERIFSYYYAPGYYPSGIVWIDDHLWVTDYGTNKLFKTLPRERIEEIVTISVPSWFGTVLVITILPILLSIVTVLKNNNTQVPIHKKNEYKTSNVDNYTHSLLFVIAYFLAIIGSIYSSYEVFRIVYNVVILKRPIIIDESYIYFYKLEMFLCIYTGAFWFSYLLVRGLNLLSRLRTISDS